MYICKYIYIISVNKCNSNFNIILCTAVLHEVIKE